MFEMVAGAGRVIPPYRRVRTALVSIAGHGLVLVAVVLVPWLAVTTDLPAPPVMMAFVVRPPAPPPPPPPPAPPGPSRAVRERPAATTGQLAVPVEAPAEIEPESGLQGGVAGGVEDGVEGGVPGGMMGGVLGGLPSEVPPPPPAPAAPAPSSPVRVGGAITAPALVARVDPKYPLALRMARVEGYVILEATVDSQGAVESVRVLRSAGMLDGPAMEAVRQWRYSPLTLNGRPTSFILTVTVAFVLDTQPNAATE